MNRIRSLLLLALALTPVLAGSALADNPPPKPRHEADFLHRASPVPRRVISPAAPAQQESRPLLRRSHVDAVKAATAAAGTLLLAAGAWLARRGRPAVLRRFRDGLLAGLGLLAALCWWNLLQFHYPGFGHPADNFHYYLGAKYFRELGYTRLYRCAAIADDQAGAGPSLSRRSFRNLETNRLESGTALAAEPALCTDHFSPERWADFRRDVDWMRKRLPARRWQQIFLDHGYNATPAWGVLGTLLTDTGPVSASQLRWLTALDSLLLLAMWSCAWWAFGWRATCVALLFWGTNYAAGFSWTGGGILRQDWLVASVVGLCLLRRGFPRGGGFLLAVASLLRIFPAVLLGALALKAGIGLVRNRTLRLAPEQRAVAQGALLAVVLLVPLSLWIGGDTGVWKDFVANSRVHLETPLRNNVGLATALAYDPTPRQTPPGVTLAEEATARRAARSARLAERRPIQVAALLGSVVLLGVAVRSQPDWAAAILGLALLPVAFELTSYYYALLLAFGFLWARRRAVGVALVALSALSWAIVQTWHFYGIVFARFSLAAVAFVLLALVLLIRRPEDVSTDQSACTGTEGPLQGA